MLGATVRLWQPPRVRTYGLAALLGGVVGALAGVYLAAVHFLEGLVWDGQEPRLPGDPRLATVLTCVGGGVVVGLLRLHHERDTPHELEDALAQLDDSVAGKDAEALPSVRWLLRAAVLGMVSLAAGGSVGPEAPLLVLAIGLGRRTARILRVSQGEAAFVSSAAALSGLFGGPFGAVALGVERSRARGRAASLLGPGLVAGVAGLVAFVVTLPDGGRTRYSLPAVPGTPATTVMWAVAAGVLGTAVGVLLLVALPPARRLAERLVRPTVLRAVAGGLVLGVCGALIALTLFSGQREAQDLIDGADEFSVGYLLALIALKLVATLGCLASGWFGGQIFPTAFSGMAAGLLLHAVVPSAPTAVVVAAGAGAATTALLRRPLAAALVMVLFFPLEVLLPLLVGAGVGAIAVGALGARLPEQPKLGAEH